MVAPGLDGGDVDTELRGDLVHGEQAAGAGQTYFWHPTGWWPRCRSGRAMLGHRHFLEEMSRRLGVLQAQERDQNQCHDQETRARPD